MLIKDVKIGQLYDTRCLGQHITVRATGRSEHKRGNRYELVCVGIHSGDTYLRFASELEPIAKQEV